MAEAALRLNARHPEPDPSPPGAPPPIDHALTPTDLEQILDAHADFIVCLDRQWNFSFANRSARELLRSDDLIGANLWTRFPGNLNEPFASNYRAAMDDGSAVEFEAYAGHVRSWMRIQARPLNGGIVIFFRDITDRKQAEAVRDTTERHLQQVLEATTDAVVSLNREWNYTFLNHHATVLLGREDLVGKNLWHEFATLAADGFSRPLHRTMDQRVPTDVESFYGHPLNLWLRVQCRPSQDGIVVFFRNVTEERASQEILLDQQAALAFVQQTARVATWQIDLDTGVITFGDGSFPVFGRPFTDIGTVEAFRHIVHPDDRARQRTNTPRAIANRDVAVIDYRVIAPDGSILWMEGRSIAVFNKDDVPTHIRGMTTDITARKRNDEQLLASEERYRVLSDLNPQALWMGDTDGTIVYANQGCLEYIGMTPADVGGIDWSSAFDPEDRDRVIAAWTHSVLTGDEYAIEARLIRASDGMSRWCLLRGLPVRNEAGAIQQWLGVTIDIHDTRTAAEALRQKQEETERQRAELETVYRTAPIGLALFDPVEFRYLRLNDRQAAILGVPCEDAIGRTLTEMAPIPGLHDMFQQVAAGHPVQDRVLEGEIPTRPGEHRFWNVNYFPVYAADGTVQAISAASLEITHQRRSELALIQSEKLAAVGRLASSISHEINNPLEAITNLLYLVATDPILPDPLKVYVHMAQSELTRVSQIATQTLRFHRQAVAPTFVSPADLVNAVLHLYQGRLANSGIRVDARYASATRVLCLENDIRQVLNNLIANAIDAMRGGGRLLVRAHDATLSNTNESAVDVPPRHGVRITIADTGHGMPPEVQARIFEPFYTTKDLNGTGLGLWISAGIVAHHQGSLTARSSRHPAHHGTVFTLFLPCIDG